MLVFNGDVLSCLDPAEVVRTHCGVGVDVTLHLVRVPDPRVFGCVPTTAEGQVLGFREKTDDPPTDLINAGCYAFRREVIDLIPVGRTISVEHETFPGLFAAGARLHAYVDAAYWLDRGAPRPPSCKAPPTWCAAWRPHPRFPGRLGEALLLPGATVHPDARVEGGSVVGAGAVLHDAMVGDGAVVGVRCELRDGLRVWPGVVLPDDGVRFSADACDLLAVLDPAAPAGSLCGAGSAAPWPG